MSDALTSETDRTTERTSKSGSASPREGLLSGLAVEERHAEVAGVRTAILEGGDGPSLVLLHGPGEHAPKWRDTIEGLVDDYRVVAPDLPGHGASDPADGPLDAALLMSWLEALVEECCEEPPTLVGHIVGGAIAARLRSRMGARWPVFEAYNLDRARTPKQQAAMGSLMENFGFPPIPAEELASISVPTVLIWGREDLATDVEVAEEASERYGWPLYVIDDAADDPPLERPEEFVRAFRAATGRQGSSAAQGTSLSRSRSTRPSRSADHTSRTTE